MSTTLIIFGVTGDLVALKVLPALFEMYQKNIMPRGFSVIGVSRRDWSDQDLKAYIKDALQKDTKDFTDTALDDFLTLFSYHKVELTTPVDFDLLKKKIESLRENILFYFALAPIFYEQVFHEFKRVGLGGVRGDSIQKMLIEKPFGTDLKTARALNGVLTNDICSEEYIYRIDHYLAKDVLHTILNIRKDPTLEQLWDTLTKIQVNLLETVGVEKRGHFYDTTGALKDVGQNHILQMLAYIVLDMSEIDIQKARADIFLHLKVKEAIHSQYEGYRAVEGVDNNSVTETYFNIKAGIDLPRCKGIEIILQGGKKMKNTQKNIVITSKTGSVLTLSFEGNQPVSEYAIIFTNAMQGNKEYFVSEEEVEAQWKFVDSVIDIWEKREL